MTYHRDDLVLNPRGDYRQEIEEECEVELLSLSATADELGRSYGERLTEETRSAMEMVC